MGKRQKEKKLARLESVAAERQAVSQRRQERLAPVIRLARNFFITFAATIALLYLGFFVNKHLAGIISRILLRSG